MYAKGTFLKTIHRKKLWQKKTSVMKLRIYNCTPSTSFPSFPWKVQKCRFCRFGSLPTFWCLFKSNTLKISYTLSTEAESCYDVKPLAYVETNISKDFQIIISEQYTFQVKSAIMNNNHDKLQKNLLCFRILTRRKSPGQTLAIKVKNLWVQVSTIL